MMKKYLCPLIFSLLILVLFFSKIESLGWHDYKDFVSALINVAAIIFGVVGAWLAIIYPKLIEGCKTDKFNISIYAEQEFYSYVEIVLVSAIVLVSLVSLQYASIFSSWIDGVYIYYLRYVLFLVVSTLAGLQITCLFVLVVKSFIMLNEFTKVRLKKRDDDLA